MDKKTIIMLFINHKNNTQTDIEAPVDITAGELIYGLNVGLNLGMNTEDIYQCHLSAENPIMLVRGNKTLSELSLRNGTVLHFT